MIKFLVDNYGNLIDYSSKQLDDSIYNICVFGKYKIIKIILNYINYNDEILKQAYNDSSFNIVALLIKNKKVNVNYLKYIHTTDKFNIINKYLFENGLTI